MKKILLSLLVISAFSAQGAFAQDLTQKALDYVENSTVFKVKKDEVEVLTANKTIVEIDFDRKGNLEEASGENVDLDNFNPKNGNLSLVEALNSIQALGETVHGEWSYEHEFQMGWYYEFNGIKNNVEYEFIIDAKTGKLLRSKID